MTIANEWILPVPPSPQNVTEVRSTLLISSRHAVTSAGYEAAYVAALDPEQRATVLDAVAGVWLPAAAAVAHYQACEKLGVSAEVALAVGRTTGKRMEGTVLGTAMRLVREVGVTPWTMLEQFQRFWGRAFIGGYVAVLKVGPKDARVVYGHCMLCDIPYFRGALRGVATSLLAQVCDRVFMNEIPSARRPRCVTYRVQWA